MNIPIEQWGISGVMFVSGIITGAIAWNNIQRDVKSLEDRDKAQQKIIDDSKTELAREIYENKVELNRKIDDVVKWSHEYEEKAGKRREDLMKDISRLEGVNLVVGEQLKQVLILLTEIKERLSSLESTQSMKRGDIS